jgi:hypothetical protein
MNDLPADVQLKGSSVTDVATSDAADDFSDLAAAAFSSMDFWLDQIDDEDWNNA